jgi:hypothetical protein
MHGGVLRNAGRVLLFKRRSRQAKSTRRGAMIAARRVGAGPVQACIPEALESTGIVETTRHYNFIETRTAPIATDRT